MRIEERCEALTDRLDRIGADLDTLTRRLDDGDAERQRQAEALDAMHRAVDDIHALKDQTASLADAIESQERGAANLADAVEAGGRTTVDLSATVERQREMLEALAAAAEQRHGESADKTRDIEGRLDRVEERGEHGTRTAEQVRVDVMRIERQAAIDLAMLRAADEALARAVTVAAGSNVKAASLE